MERVLTLSFQLKDGKFSKDQGQVVGKVMPDGKVQGTDYQFDPSEIHGGVAVTTNGKLEKIDEDTLFNPATGSYFEKSRSGKGYFDRVNKKFVKVWNTLEEDG